VGWPTVERATAAALCRFRVQGFVLLRLANRVYVQEVTK
jgi:hypothetical protein